MAEKKKSFILYVDLIHTIEKLPNEEAGELFKHILRYVNDQNPTTENILVDISFEPIKQQLKRDLKAWEGSKEDKSIAGIKGNLKRWNSDLYEQVVSKKITLEEAQSIAEHRRTSQPDKVRSQNIANIAVNDNVNVNVNVNDIKEKPPTPKGEFNFDVYLKKINELFGKQLRVVNDKAKRSIKARLKEGYSKADIWNAMQNVANDNFHKDNNYQYATPQYFAQVKTLDMHGGEIKKPKPSHVEYKLHD